MRRQTACAGHNRNNAVEPFFRHLGYVPDGSLSLPLDSSLLDLKNRLARFHDRHYLKDRADPCALSGAPATGNTDRLENRGFPSAVCQGTTFSRDGSTRTHYRTSRLPYR